MSNNRPQIRSNQSGLVSIIVGISFIIIISLIATSFALLSRREARQALDRQLSTQAFYAAETGVNDAIEQVRAGNTSITDCGTVNSLNGGGANLGNGLSYTCVLVNSAPTDIKLQQDDKASTTRLETNEAISKIRISWQNTDGNQNTFAATSPALPLFPKEGTPNSYSDHIGVLRATLIPASGPVSRQGLIDNSQTLFLYPSAGSPAGTPGTVGAVSSQAQQGAIVDGKCNTGNNGSNLPRYCNVEITGLTGGQKLYYLRLKSLYQESDVSVQAFGAGGQPLQLLNSQAVIDATGKANDVLRRIQVRIPYGTQFVTPDFALQATDGICKKIQVTSTSVIDNCN